MTGDLDLYIQSDPPIPAPAIPDIRYTGRAEKAPASQFHLAITDKLKFWWFRYNENVVSHVRYKGVGLYIYIATRGRCGETTLFTHLQLIKAAFVAVLGTRSVGRTWLQRERERERERDSNCGLSLKYISKN